VFAQPRRGTRAREAPRRLGGGGDACGRCAVAGDDHDAAIGVDQQHRRRRTGRDPVGGARASRGVGERGEARRSRCGRGGTRHDQHRRHRLVRGERRERVVQRLRLATLRPRQREHDGPAAERVGVERHLPAGGIAQHEGGSLVARLEPGRHRERRLAQSALRRLPGPPDPG